MKLMLIVEHQYTKDIVQMSFCRYSCQSGGIGESGIWNLVTFGMQKISPSKPRRDESDHAASHHAADAEDGDDEGPDEGDGGVARRVQRLPFLQVPICQLCKERGW